MLTKSYSVLIFDFDGTLFDTSEGVVHCFTWAFEEAGLRVPRADDIQRTMGLPLERAARELAPSASPDTVSDLADLFLLEADRSMVQRSVPMSDMERVVKQLDIRGTHLAIVTGKYRARVIRLLVEYDLESYFNPIICGDEVPGKPDPCGIEEVMARFSSIDRTEFAYVGDSWIDICTARNANIASIAIASGKQPAQELARHEPDYLISDLTQLLSP